MCRTLLRRTMIPAVLVLFIGASLIGYRLWAADYLACEWVLRAPGDLLAGAFKTRPGDDVGGLLATRFADVRGALQARLAEQEIIEISRMRVSGVPLRLRLWWWRRGRGTLKSARLLEPYLTAAVTCRSQERLRYEIRFRRASEEWAAGPFEDYNAVERAMRVEMARTIRNVDAVAPARRQLSSRLRPARGRPETRN